MSESKQLEYKISPNREDVEKYTAAAGSGDVQTVEQFLMKWPLLIDIPDGHSWTALMQAAWHGHDSIVTKLIARGAKRDLLDKWGRTAWVLARRQRHKTVMELIYPSKNLIPAKNGEW